MEKLTIPNKLVKICDAKNSTSALKTAMLICKFLNDQYNNGEAKIFLPSLREKKLAPYAAPAIKKGKEFLKENLLGKIYKISRFQSYEYITKSDKFFKYKTIDVPFILTTNNLSIRAVCFYLRALLYCRNKKSKKLKFCLRKVVATDKEIDFFNKFFSLPVAPNKNNTEQDDFKTRFRINKTFRAEFQNIVKSLENYNLVKITKIGIATFEVEIFV